MNTVTHIVTYILGFGIVYNLVEAASGTITRYLMRLHVKGHEIEFLLYVAIVLEFLNIFACVIGAAYSIYTKSIASLIPIALLYSIGVIVKINKIKLMTSMSVTTRLRINSLAQMCFFIVIIAV